MLEIMLSNITADLALTYGWGDMVVNVLNAAKSGQGFASSMEKVESTVKNKINKLYKDFKD